MKKLIIRRFVALKFMSE